MGVFLADDFDNHEQVVFASDAASGLSAIIAIFSTALGPSIGGLRIWPYESEAAALRDVLRLSRGMAYKAAIAGVPFGGGKAVVMLAPGEAKTPAMLRAMGRAIEQLGGRYITGEDVGTTAADMAEIRRATDKVMGLPVELGGSGDPSPNTALGCFVGIAAAARHRLGRDDLDGLRVVVQGLGNVGWNLARQLAEAGARLTVADVRADRVERAVEAFRAAAVAPDAVYDVDADVFAPCALGAVIDDGTVERLKVSIVAGGANNQLARPGHGRRLRERGILYAPDYVINGGGMIQLAAERLDFEGRGTYQAAEVERKIRAIGETLETIFQRAETEGWPPELAADRLAEERMAAADI